jgi:hypothetical protein
MQVRCLSDKRTSDGKLYMYLRTGKVYDVRWETDRCFVIHTVRGDTHYPKGNFKVVPPDRNCQRSGDWEDYCINQLGDREDDL